MDNSFYLLRAIIKKSRTYMQTAEMKKMMKKEV